MKIMFLAVLVIALFCRPTLAFSQLPDCSDATTIHPNSIHLKVELVGQDLVQYPFDSKAEIVEAEMLVAMAISRELEPTGDFVNPWKIVPIDSSQPDQYPLIRIRIDDAKNSNGFADNWDMTVEIQGTEHGLSKAEIGTGVSVLDSIAHQIGKEDYPILIAETFRLRFRPNPQMRRRMWEKFPISKAFVTKNKIPFTDPTIAQDFDDQRTMILVSPLCYMDFFDAITTRFEIRCVNDQRRVLIKCEATDLAALAIVDQQQKLCLIVKFNEQIDDLTRQSLEVDFGDFGEVFFDRNSIPTIAQLLGRSSDHSDDYLIGD